MATPLTISPATIRQARLDLLRDLYAVICGNVALTNGECQESYRAEAQEIAAELTRCGKPPVLTIDEQAALAWGYIHVGPQRLRTHLLSTTKEITARAQRQWPGWPQAARFYWHPYPDEANNRWHWQALLALAKQKQLPAPPPCPYPCCAPQPGSQV